MSYTITISGDAPDADTEQSLLTALTDALAANVAAGVATATASTDFHGSVDLAPVVTPPPPPVDTVDVAFGKLGAAIDNLPGDLPTDEQTYDELVDGVKVAYDNAVAAVDAIEPGDAAAPVQEFAL